MKHVATFEQGLDTPVTIQQRADGTFKVTYGLEVYDNLTYELACTQLGGVLMHSLACAGHITDTEED